LIEEQPAAAADADGADADAIRARRRRCAAGRRREHDRSGGRDEPSPGHAPGVAAGLSTKTAALIRP